MSDLGVFEASARLLYEDDDRIVPWEQADGLVRQLYLRSAQRAHRYIVHPKRLSGPELAAEYYRILYEGLPVAELQVMDRFATLPHYDEEPT